MREHNFIKEYYDKYVKDKDYEKERWFKDNASKERYEETKKTIIFLLGKENYKDVLDIGCGPGTWSKLLIEKSKKLFLVDISKEMLKQAKKKLKLEKNIKYMCSDFLNFKTRKKFDLIFSVRAIEYMTNKKKVIKKMFEMLKNKGKVIIITKNPARRWRYLLFGKQVEEIHKNWASSSEIRKVLEEVGFEKIKHYPAVFSVFPFPNFFLTRKINGFVHSLFYKNQIKNLMVPFLESYVVVAYKLL